MKHTPAPWKWWDADSGRPEKYDLAKLIGSDGSSILTTYGGSGLDALKNPADAAHIVRSVNHFEALRTALKAAVEVLEEASGHAYTAQDATRIRAFAQDCLSLTRQALQATEEQP